MTATDVTTVVVVVPVHNEAELLDRCLTALGEAVATAAGRGIRCVVRIVLDDCTDGSALIAAAHPFPTMVISAAGVGDARARGVEAAMREVGGVPPRRVWIANTDADSAVPANWIVTQCDLAANGADVFVGTVRPDFADLSPRHRRHWLRTHRRGCPERTRPRRQPRHPRRRLRRRRRIRGGRRARGRRTRAALPAARREPARERVGRGAHLRTLRRSHPGRVRRLPACAGANAGSPRVAARPGAGQRGSTRRVVWCERSLVIARVADPLPYFAVYAASIAGSWDESSVYDTARV